MRLDVVRLERQRLPVLRNRLPACRPPAGGPSPGCCAGPGCPARGPLPAGARRSPRRAGRLRSGPIPGSCAPRPIPARAAPPPGSAGAPRPVCSRRAAGCPGRHARRRAPVAGERLSSVPRWPPAARPASRYARPSLKCGSAWPGSSDTAFDSSAMASAGLPLCASSEPRLRYVWSRTAMIGRLATMATSPAPASPGSHRRLEVAVTKRAAAGSRVSARPLASTPQRPAAPRPGACPRDRPVPPPRTAGRWARADAGSGRPRRRRPPPAPGPRTSRTGSGAAATRRETPSPRTRPAAASRRSSARAVPAGPVSSPAYASIDSVSGNSAALTVSSAFFPIRPSQ